MMRHERNCIVLDIGGTTLRAGVLTAGRRLLSPVIRGASPSFLTHPRESGAELQRLLVEAIATVVQRLRSAHPHRRLDRIGIAVPGPTTRKGVVRMAPPLWGKFTRPFPLRARVERRLRMTCLVVNDLTAAAASYGALQRFRRHRWICVVAISSGVGNKVFDTKLGEALIDVQGYAGELGHVTIQTGADAPLCDCGVRGHLSAIASGRGAVRFAQRWAGIHPGQFRQSVIAAWTGQRPQAITAEVLAKGVRAGDRFAVRILEHVTRDMAQALSVLAGSVGVERIILIGGFALGVGLPYLRAIRRHMTRLGMFGRSSQEARNLVCLGDNADDAGLIGVGILAQRLK